MAEMAMGFIHSVAAGLLQRPFGPGDDLAAQARQPHPTAPCLQRSRSRGAAPAAALTGRGGPRGSACHR